MHRASSILIGLFAALSSAASAQTYDSRQGVYFGIGQSLTAANEIQVEGVIHPGGLTPITLFGTMPSNTRAMFESDAYNDNSTALFIGFDFQRSRMTWAIEASHNTGRYDTRGNSNQVINTLNNGSVFFNRDNFSQIYRATLTDSVDYNTRLEDISSL